MSVKTLTPQPTFSSRLRQLLDSADMTAYRLAQVSGVPKQTLSHYLLGNREPAFGNLVKIAKALNVSLSEFDVIERK